MNALSIEIAMLELLSDLTIEIAMLELLLELLLELNVPPRCVHLSGFAQSVGLVRFKCLPGCCSTIKYSNQNRSPRLVQ